MLNKLGDLRLSIGSFFFIVGCLLIVAGLTQGDTPDAAKLNYTVGAFLIAFGLLGIGFAVIRPLK